MNAPDRTAPFDELWLAEVVLPEHANHYGSLFGPHALALLGKAAFLVASRHAQRAVVMAAARRIDFRVPIRVGTLLNLHARIARVGRSSMTVRVEARPAAPAAVPDLPALYGDFVMVAVDAAGRPVPLAAAPAAASPAAASPCAQSRFCGAPRSPTEPCKVCHE